MTNFSELINIIRICTGNVQLMQSKAKFLFIDKWCKDYVFFHNAECKTLSLFTARKTIYYL